MTSPETPVDADAIAQRQFSTARRGLDVGEVRAYLAELAQLVARLQQAEARQRDRAEEATARAEQVERPDRHQFVTMLGEETARVLDAARDAAADIREKAEGAAARLISQANDDAHQRRAEGEAEVLVLRNQMLADIEALRQDAQAELEHRRAEGEQLVAEMRREGQQAAGSLRQEGEQARAAAVVEAAGLRDAAQEEARRLVTEARTLRQRMLEDLSRRRRAVREQLELLNAVRDRLLAAYDVVRRTVEEATAELTIAVPEAKLAGAAARRRVQGEPEPSAEVLESEVSMARMAGLLAPLPDPDAALDALLDPDPSGSAELPDPAEPADAADVYEPTELAESPDAAGPDDEAEPVEPAAPAEPVDVVESADPGEGVDPVTAESTRAQEPQPANHEADFSDPYDDLQSDVSDPYDDLEPAASNGHDSTSNGATPHAVQSEAEHPSQLDLLFERLRVGTATADASPAESSEQSRFETASGGEALPDADDVEAGEASASAIDSQVLPTTSDGEVLVRQRDESLEPLERALSRRLKRVLADEQNELLDLVRRQIASSGDELLPEPEAHARRYGDAAADELHTAAYWGAAAAGGSPAGSCDALADELGAVVTEPLRERVAHSWREADGDLDELTERLRALYREWKNRRVDEAVRHFAAAAYARGAYDAVEDGTPLRWIVDVAGSSCPDAEDNALATPICKGDPFPTGHAVPPAHPGCRCLAMPVVEAVVAPSRGAMDLGPTM